jgi:hypothetical protein
LKPRDPGLPAARRSPPLPSPGGDATLRTATRPMATPDRGGRLDQRNHGHGSDRGWPPILASAVDLHLLGGLVSCRRLLFRNGARRVAHLCQSSSVAFPIAWARCSTSCTGRRSGRGPSARMSCFTCSCWPAVWLTTCSFSRWLFRSHGGLELSGPLVTRYNQDRSSFSLLW